MTKLERRISVGTRRWARCSRQARCRERSEVRGDGGLLFAPALITLVSSLVVPWIRGRGLPVAGKRIPR